MAAAAAEDAKDAKDEGCRGDSVSSIFLRPSPHLQAVGGFMFSDLLDIILSQTVWENSEKRYIRSPRPSAAGLDLPEARCELANHSARAGLQKTLAVLGNVTAESDFIHF